MTFGQKLEVLRKEQGCSQEGLAAQLEVSRQAVSKWESDRGLPKTEKLLQISNMFGVTLDYLLKEECMVGEHQNEGYYVSREMIDGFLSEKRRGAKRLALGVGSLFFAGFWEWFFHFSQIGMALYWLTTAFGIAALVWHFFQPKRYKEIYSRQLIFDETVIRNFREECIQNKKRYAFMVILGVLIFILGPSVLLVVRGTAGSEMTNAISWLLSTIGAVLFLLAGLSIRAENIIAQNTEFSLKRKKRGSFAWVYAALPLTGIAVFFGIATNAWSPAMPIIVVLCVLLVTLCKLLLEGRNLK